MTIVSCDDFEKLLNTRLDSRGLPAFAVDEALASHAMSCPHCREIEQRYALLGRALDAWKPAPTPSESLGARILAAHAMDSARREGLKRRFATASWWSAAAAVLVLAVGGFVLRPWAGTGERLEPRIALDSPPTAARFAPPPSPLSLAFSEATAATLELAMETSAPAARVGRGVLAAATVSRTRFAAPSVMPETPADGLQSLENGVTQTVRPLSGSARNAFSFLLPSDLGG